MGYNKQYTAHRGAAGSYHDQVRAVAAALWTDGADATLSVCPREECSEVLQAGMDGMAVVVRCPHCGVIFRGNLDVLLRGV